MSTDNQKHFYDAFLTPLMKCYGDAKFPEPRVKVLLDKMRHYPINSFKLCADKIILNFDNFPGVQKILDTVAEVVHISSRDEAEMLKMKSTCRGCLAQGVRVIDNVAYQCTCDLGRLLYPNFAMYNGQIETPEKIWFDEEGNRHFENGYMHSITPKGCRDIRKIKTIIKSNNPNYETHKTDYKKLAYGDFDSLKGA